ncbi:MAG: S8 family serine peptidase [Crocinitomicaceae bacterium]|nr:S8 family serine peptidase [Crocinitomicaceae bacterium]
MKYFCYCCLLFLVTLVKVSSAQVAPGKYRVRFSDKSSTPYSLSQPEYFLSSKTIERRLRFGLGFDSLDMPIDPSYIQQVLELGNCTLHNKSKWFNTVTIEVTDTSLANHLLAQLHQLPFVADVKQVLTYPSSIKLAEENKMTILPDEDEKESLSLFMHYKDGGEFLYGPSFRQIEMINGHLLHQNGYTGRGIDVALFDGGWIFADLLPAFQLTRSEGRIKETRDFVNPQSPVVFGASSHGTFVLSHLCGIISDSLMGTAPDANYFLFRTEDVGSEYPVEEDNWVAAAEYSDSIGIDIINSSLGYSVFDDTLLNYTYEAMNGQTTHISIAADIAGKKGILVVNSAGNNGDDDWHFLTAPSDGEHVLCVGAVDAEGIHAPFSGYGPSSDGRVKPNVMAMGKSTVFAALDSTIATGSGTSFSSPVLAGAAACLWQAFPLCSNMEIFHAIEQSASLYSSPNDSMGYGIPDFWKAYHILDQKIKEPLSGNEIAIFPNPANEILNIRLLNATFEHLRYEVTDITGKRIIAPVSVAGDDLGSVVNTMLDLTSLASGWYVLRVAVNGNSYSLPFEKVSR